MLLHATAGLGNAVSALATARVNRAPLVVVGQQDRVAAKIWNGGAGAHNWVCYSLVT